MSTAPRTTSPDPAASPTHSSEPAIIRQEREILGEVLRLVAERAAAETEVESARVTGDATADREYQRMRQTLVAKFAEMREKARRGDEERRRAIIETAISGEAEAKGEFARASRRIAADFDAVRERAKNEHRRDQGEAASAFEAREREAAARYAEARRPIDSAAQIIEGMRARLDALYNDYRKFGLADPPTTPTRESYDRFEDPAGQLLDRLAKLDTPLAILEGLIIPKAVKGSRYLWLFVIVFLMLIIPSVWLGGEIYGAIGAVCATVALGLLLRTWLYSLSKMQVSRLFVPLSQSIVDADALAAYCRAKADDQLKERRAKAAQQREDDLQAAKQRQARTIREGEELRDDRLRRINEVYAQRQVEIQTTQQTDLRQAIDAYDQKKAEIEAKSEAKTRELEEKYQALKTKVRTRYEASWAEMAGRWREGMTRARTALDELTHAVDALGPTWADPAWADRPFPSRVPPVVRFGEIPIDLHQLPGGVSSDPRLRDGIPEAFALPALRPFPAHGNLVVEAPADGRPSALALLQSAMFRLLTSLPPGLVRFTIVDPLGIGRNFGAFMHLADFDEALVNGQAWTEPRQIEERLADLSAHMEKVAQRYLRNEYATIEDYNAVAGELAEPYRVPVIADFPAGFDEKTAARLASIASGGVPCGVLTLVAVDRDRPLPVGFSLDDLRSHALSLDWNGTRLSWDDPDFGRYALVLDPPPPTDFATRMIQRVGAAARDAKRVVVPFEFIAPPSEAWWSKDSRTGLDVPLGKSGATKRQHLALGQGTSQHVLIAGRTGSGKSTLLHALITNLALNYSPDQVEMYLIDFKKGVEFKVYATHELPHAAVVAIESEREFGISVLQRLDAELKLRADRFREAGVQDLNGYRNVPGTTPLPRIVLIVDEFQEFFVEDDRLAQEAALLLDRLVRQGRAFGVHVHLGSQTLGGAYVLARSTLGQMAVRIALQCSETDAHLILSEQNPAARLLSRPGEAIYNDANGLPEGNHFFQVVWLPDDRRETYLDQIHTLALERKPVLSRTMVVFEGDAPAELARNPLLKARLDAPSWPESPRSAHAWLGDAVAIKDPTSALFRRQGGNHLLTVGQNDEAALAIHAASVLSLAAQYPPPESDTVRSGARFAIVDGTPEDHPRAELLARVASALPHPVTAVGWRDAARVVAEVAAEVERRQQAGAPDGPEIFLVLHDLPRLRDLRKREDDFSSFSRREEGPSPSEQLGNILREGPGLGVHILAWCDTVNNLYRVFDHQALREFEMRVLFQMSATDSGHLLDSPHASKLGPHRAYFSSGEENRLEKFRPYGLPSVEWLAQVRDLMRQRVAAVGG